MTLTSDRNSNFINRSTVFLTITYVFAGLIFTVLGKIHVDEGAYLYAANAVYQGKLPYRDFFFLQPPLYPFIYGLVQHFVTHGLAAGRLTSLGFGLLTLLLAAGTAHRLGGAGAACITMLFLVFNPAQVYFFTITRLFALTGFFFTAAAFLISDPKRRAASYFGAAISLALAADTRLTVLPALLPSAHFLLVTYSNKPRRWMLSWAIVLLVIAGVYAPFYWLAPDRFFFNVLGLNLSLHARAPLVSIIEKLRTLSHLLRHYYFLAICCCAAVVFNVRKIVAGAGSSLSDFQDQPKVAGIRPRDTTRLLLRLRSLTRLSIWRLPHPEFTLWSMVALITMGHLAAKIFQEAYQSFLAPLLMALVAVQLNRLIGTSSALWRTRIKYLLLCGAALTVLSQGRENLQMIGSQTPLGLIRTQARFISSHTDPHDKLFSADSALLAVESGRDILEGMAGSDYFPAWSAEKCRRFKVMNDEIVTEYIASQAGRMLLIGDSSFTLTLPELEAVPAETRQKLWSLIASRYELVRTDPNLHVPDTKLYFYLAKTASSEN